MAVKYLRVVNRDQCIGCFSCMFACSRMLRNAAGSGKAALRVKAHPGAEGVFSIRVCARCSDPDCAAACPTGALTTAPGGGVRLNKEVCVSCGACVKGCTLGALQWDEEDKRPIPCIQCGQCVKYCPNSVLALSEKKEGGDQR